MDNGTEMQYALQYCIAVCTVQEIFALFLALNIRTYTKFESQNTPYIGGGAGRAGGSVAPTPLPPPKKQITNIGGKNPPLPRFGAGRHFYGCI